MKLKRNQLIGSLSLLGFVLLGTSGCIVGQPPGKGKVMHIQEPKTKGWYYLYLPEDYVKFADQVPEQRWPLVVTFHGMRPFDDYGSQIREWQQEADRYGFVVMAPRTETSALFSDFGKVRVTKVHNGVKRDEEVTMAAMDDVAKRVNIDPTKVLSTSWSSGGYLAHYMVNRHPDRFSCVAPRQSNFSSDIMSDDQAAKYRDMKVGIFYTENDFAICQRESQEAAQWYAKHGFDVTFAVFRDLGHERRPSVAADFFAKQIGATAKTPPTELARMQVKRVPLPRLNGKHGKPDASKTARDKPNGSTQSGSAQVTQASRQSRNNRPQPMTQGLTGSRAQTGSTGPLQSNLTTSSVYDSPSNQAKSSGSQVANRWKSHRNSNLRIRVSSTIGIAPHLVSFSAITPPTISDGAEYLWMSDGEAIGNGINAQKRFTTPGKHKLELMMTTKSGEQYIAQKNITILEPVERQQ